MKLPIIKFEINMLDYSCFAMLYLTFTVRISSMRPMLGRNITEKGLLQYDGEEQRKDTSDVDDYDLFIQCPE